MTSSHSIGTISATEPSDGQSFGTPKPATPSGYLETVAIRGGQSVRQFGTSESGSISPLIPKPASQPFIFVEEPLQRPVVIMGSLEPVIREGLVSALSTAFDVLDHPSSGPTDAFADSVQKHALALFVSYDDALGLEGKVPPGLTVVGISTHKMDAVIVRADRFSWGLDLTPDGFGALIRDLVASG